MNACLETWAEEQVPVSVRYQAGSYLNIYISALVVECTAYGITLAYEGDPVFVAWAAVIDIKKTADVSEDA